MRSGKREAGSAPGHGQREPRRGIWIGDSPLLQWPWTDLNSVRRNTLYAYSNRLISWPRWFWIWVPSTIGLMIAGALLDSILLSAVGRISLLTGAVGSLGLARANTERQRALGLLPYPHRVSVGCMTAMVAALLVSGLFIGGLVMMAFDSGGE